MDTLKIAIMVFALSLQLQCGQKSGGNPGADPTEPAPQVEPSRQPDTTPVTSKTGDTTQPPAKSDDGTPLPPLKNAETPPAPDDSEKINEAFFDTDDQPQILSTYQDKPLVVLVGSFGCTGCTKETLDLIAYIKAKLGDRLPTNINIVTILIASVREDAADWQSELAIPWTVGYQDNTSIMDNYCDKKKTPCTIVRVPYKGVVLKTVGEVAPAELENLTGAWQ